MNRLAAPLVALALFACTPQQLADANYYRVEIERACQQALIVEWQFPWISQWIADCRTASGIAKAALDPSYHEWLRGILGRL